MNKLVVHHTYANGSTFDVSNSLNHGIPINVGLGAGSFATSFYYGAGDSVMAIAPSESLRDLGAIRARVRFFHSPAGGGARRHNLIEGHLSFALFINPDRSLQATILDLNANWRGATSAAGIVVPNRWHEVEYTYDGMGQLRIVLDGALVAAAFDLVGTVRTVGQNGIAIGHWPEPDSRYTFQGYIGEVQLYKYDPKEEVRDLLDPCCIDRTALDKERDRLRDEGWTAERLGDRVRNLLELAAEVTAAVRAGDANETRDHEQNATEALTAFMRHDSATYRAAFARIVAQADRNVSDSQIDNFGTRILREVEGLPFTPDQITDLARALCWQHGILDDLEQLVPHHRNRPHDRKGE